MTEEIGGTLREIADLLRQRVEQQERALAFQERTQQEQQERADGTLERLKEQMPKIELPDMPQFDWEEHRREMQEMRERSEEARQAQMAFQERLLAELERHNGLLEQLLARLGR
jgi:hypothetical protein